MADIICQLCSWPIKQPSSYACFSLLLKQSVSLLGNQLINFPPQNTTAEHLNFYQEKHL